MDSRKIRNSESKTSKRKISRRIKAQSFIKSTDHSKDIKSPKIQNLKSSFKRERSVVSIKNMRKQLPSTFIKLQQCRQENIFSQNCSSERSNSSCGTPKFNISCINQNNNQMETRLLSDEENNDFFINFYSESINKCKLIKNKIDMKREPSKKINSDLVDSGILTSSDQYKFNEHSSIASLQQDAKSIQSIVGISSNDSMKSLHNSSQQSLIFKRRNISAKQNKEFLIKAHNNSKILSGNKLKFSCMQEPKWNIAESIENSLIESINKINKGRDIKMIRSSSFNNRYPNKISKLDSFKSQESENIGSTRAKKSVRSKSRFSYKSDEENFAKHALTAVDCGETPSIQARKSKFECKSNLCLPKTKKVEKVKQACSCIIF